MLSTKTLVHNSARAHLDVALTDKQGLDTLASPLDSPGMLGVPKLRANPECAGDRQSVVATGLQI
jgi:hypothetical protein